MRPQLTMTPSAAAVVALVNRGRWPLIYCRSREWHSLTFTGEQTTLQFRLADESARVSAAKLLEAVDDLSLGSGDIILADIAGSIEGDVLTIDALTVFDD